MNLDIRLCKVCKVKSCMGQPSCAACIEKCQQEVGHLLEKKQVIDNNWDAMVCLYCGFSESSQCKDPRSKDGFAP